MHYYQKNIADYRKDTGHLSHLEHGIYAQLMDTYYLEEKPIETQSVMRRLRIQTEEEKLALENILNDFFEQSECGKFWNHKRCDEEIKKYHAKAETAKVNGSKGGRPAKPKKTQSVNLANPEETQSKANHKPITNNHKPITNLKDRGRFQRPTLDQVINYMTERGEAPFPARSEAEKFLNHYDSNGWKVGKNAMKDWKAAVRNWLSRHYENPSGSKTVNLTDRNTNTIKNWKPPDEL